jgi:hypothetical protein
MISNMFQKAWDDAQYYCGILLHDGNGFAADLAQVAISKTCPGCKVSGGYC